jgi:hypothetical protein
MKLRSLSAALIAILAVGAAYATAASANWEIEKVAQANGFTETVTVKEASNFTLEGTFLGATVVLTATGLQCTTGVKCEISQAGAVEASSGQLTFTGVTLDKPSGCVSPASLTTSPLTDELIMDPSGGEPTFDKFFTDKNAKGEEVPFIEITLTGSCAIAGTPFPVKGTVTGRTENTKVSLKSQPIVFNAANQTTGGGSLVLGKNAATLSGSATNTLSGTNVGKEWGGS